MVNSSQMKCELGVVKETKAHAWILTPCELERKRGVYYISTFQDGYRRYRLTHQTLDQLISSLEKGEALCKIHSSSSP